MLNPKVLSAAVLAIGAGAVVFLSTGQDLASPATPVGGGGPVPVVIPPQVSEIPSVHAAVPAAERVAPPSTVAPAPSARPAPKHAAVKPAPARKQAPAPERAAVSTPVQQQPEPAGTEPNGSGGWQLPACYEESCVAEPGSYQSRVASDPCSGTGTECLNSGPLGQAGIVNTIADLIGWH